MKRSLAILALLAVALSSHARSYRYDEAGRLILAVYDDGSALRYTYTHGNNIDKVERLAAPAAPSGLAATRDFQVRAKLSWQDNSDDETGFVVQRRSVFSSDWQTVSILAADATEFVDTSLDPNSNYAYRVFASSATEGLESAYSVEAVASGEGSVAFYVTSIDLFDLDRSLFLLTFQGEAGGQYQLQSSSSLEAGSWAPYPWKASADAAASQQNIEGAAGPVSVYVVDSIRSRIFFRLLAVE